MPQLVGLLREHAELGPLLDDVAELAENGPAAAGVPEDDVRVRHLEERQRRHHGNRVGQQVPESGRPRHLVTGELDLAAVGRDPGQPGVHERARPVVVEIAGRQQRARLVREGLGVVPVVPVDGDDPTLGEEEGPDRRHRPARVGRDRVGQLGVGRVQVALEQVRHPLGVDHRGAVRAPRAETRERILRVAAHRVDAVPAQDRPEVRPGRLGGVPVVERADGGRALRGRHPAFGLSGPAGEGEHHAAMSGDARVPLQQPLLVEPRQPAEKGVGPPARPHRVRVDQHQPGDPVGVARSLRVLDGGLEHPVRLAPRGRPPVELGHDLGLAVHELRGQEVAEEVVVPIPLPAIVERDHQQVAVLQRLEHLVRTRLAERRVAQRSGHRGEDRRPGQERRLGR